MNLRRVACLILLPHFDIFYAVHTVPEWNEFVIYLNAKIL